MNNQKLKNQNVIKKITLKLHIIKN